MDGRAKLATRSTVGRREDGCKPDGQTVYSVASCPRPLSARRVRRGEEGGGRGAKSNGNVNRPGRGSAADEMGRFRNKGASAANVGFRGGCARRFLCNCVGRSVRQDQPPFAQPKGCSWTCGCGEVALRMAKRPRTTCAVRQGKLGLRTTQHGVYLRSTYPQLSTPEWTPCRVGRRSFHAANHGMFREGSWIEHWDRLGRRSEFCWSCSRFHPSLDTSRDAV